MPDARRAGLLLNKHDGRLLGTGHVVEEAAHRRIVGRRSNLRRDAQRHVHLNFITFQNPARSQRAVFAVDFGRGRQFVDLESLRNFDPDRIRVQRCFKLDRQSALFGDE